MAQKKVETMKLEEAMRRLEEVVQALDGEGLQLEEALKLYEEGIRLVGVCRGKLSEAERKIRILSMSPEGEITEEEFKAE